MVNRGDSFRRRRSRSNSLAPHPHDAPLNGITLTAASTAPTSALLALDSPASDSYPADDDHHTGNTRSYRSAMIGAHGVGKSALVGQFMTSECINAYCERVRNGKFHIYYPRFSNHSHGCHARGGQGDMFPLLTSLNSLK